MDDSRINYLYKILPTSHVLPPLSSSETPITLTSLDKKDGFIHLSNSIQVLRTAIIFFGNEDEILILKIPYNHKGIKENINWEVSPGTIQEYFLHLYGDLLIKYVKNIVKVKNLKKVDNNIIEGFEDG
ncbi:983_t:CDS:1 [Funneliformis geosporum]|uniref:996_t:CDS:1 n=1 Tax=Funneliformis geosporum TaxID=1117311 RepID=A0A9W4SQX9_9GLOM|nr:983_t:CDS:1 [Funneliformis geosporum]CAI2178038.1 996_t:CDS:1 [Funneliformis geosporum]